MMKVSGRAMDIGDKDKEMLYNAVIDYTFTISFTNMSHMEVMRNIHKIYGENVYSAMVNSNIKKIDSMSKLPHALDSLKILRITPIAFNSAISKYLGENMLPVIYSTYDYFIAWAALTARYSLLFDMGPIDKKTQDQIETIVLNYKSKIKK